MGGHTRTHGGGKQILKLGRGLDLLTKGFLFFEADIQLSLGFTRPGGKSSNPLLPLKTSYVTMA